MNSVEIGIVKVEAREGEFGNLNRNKWRNKKGNAIKNHKRMKKKVGCKEKEGPWVPLKLRLGKLLESSPKLDHNIINAIPISPILE